MFIEEFSIEEKLSEIFQKVGIYFEEPEFYDLPLQLDSLQFVEVIIELEETFMIKITNDFSEFEKLKSFRDFYDWIKFYFSKNKI